MERTKAFYQKMDPNTSQDIYDYWDATIAKIEEAREKFGDLILPGHYKE